MLLYWILFTRRLTCPPPLLSAAGEELQWPLNEGSGDRWTARPGSAETPGEDHTSLCVCSECWSLSASVFVTFHTLCVHSCSLRPMYEPATSTVSPSSILCRNDIQLSHFCSKLCRLSASVCSSLHIQKHKNTPSESSWLKKLRVW